MTFPTKPTFEEVYEIINAEISKRKVRWRYNLIHIDFDDVKSIILAHIFKKWEQYDHTKPLLNWVNRVTSNQITNIIRNNYTVHMPPCATCAANLGDGLCSLYKIQNSKCPLYAKWEKAGKKHDLDINLPVSVEHHQNEIHNQIGQTIDYGRSMGALDILCKKILTPMEYKVFVFLYIDLENEKDVMKILKYKPALVGKKLYSKQLENIKKSILKKIKDCDELEVSFS